ncbi:MAG TPA: FAD-dependent oxidoreductase [Acidimicrobiales bacterium]|nr:FAD-dependent oxidoreductase [Acidimicrobiales bacterium]
MRVGILGGGVTGVAIQRFLDHDSVVLEADDEPGGLCRTFFKDGFGYDLGGHILFSKNERVNELVNQLLGDNINQCRRANKILYGGRYVKYPFENDLGSLAPEDAYECLIEYLRNDFTGEVRNLSQWAYATFGKGIAEKYFIPYNEKIWNISAEQLGLDFVERIPKPPVEDVVRSALGIETEGYLHQLYFRYPREGGVHSLVQALIDESSRIACGFRVRAVERVGDEWEVSNGEEAHRFDRLVVSFPIHEAIKCFVDVPEEVQRAVEGLRYNSMRVVLVGVGNETLMDKSAVYIPDPSVVTHRVCFMGFFSDRLVPAGASSLIAEVTTNPGDGIHELSDEELTARVIGDLDRIGILQASDVVVTDVARLTYAYPVYTLDYRQNRAIVHQYFTDQGIDLCGRFAEFDYINSDECLNRAMALADRLNAGQASD